MSLFGILGDGLCYIADSGDHLVKGRHVVARVLRLVNGIAGDGDGVGRFSIVGVPLMVTDISAEAPATMAAAMALRLALICSAAAETLRAECEVSPAPADMAPTMVASVVAACPTLPECLTIWLTMAWSLSRKVLNERTSSFSLDSVGCFFGATILWRAVI